MSIPAKTVKKTLVNTKAPSSHSSKCSSTVEKATLVLSSFKKDDPKIQTSSDDKDTTWLPSQSVKSDPQQKYVLAEGCIKELQEQKDTTLTFKRSAPQHGILKLHLEKETWTLVEDDRLSIVFSIKIELDLKDPKIDKIIQHILATFPKFKLDNSHSYLYRKDLQQAEFLKQITLIGMPESIIAEINEALNSDDTYLYNQTQTQSTAYSPNHLDKCNLTSLLL